ncbi:class I SAM-dependent methyltransferase [Chryseolinea sp. T2]|uniref:class I SAM-dependent methyltransferase n=1 Tax=Chryseolinea sp. T2 TaxID=3129255 RepID=UPI003077B71E
MSKLNSYESIAGVYDRLARMVYGSAIRKSQLVHLKELKQSNEILILGGGTGWFLEELLKVNSSATVLYLEASEKMIAMAKKKISDADSRRVSFVHGTEKAVFQIDHFDAVVINFFADMFPSDELYQVIGRLRDVLKPGGRLLCTDFVNDTAWQAMLLRVMYIFFGMATGLTTKRLAPWRSIIAELGFKRLCSSAFWGSFIFSELYKKPR